MRTIFCPHVNMLWTRFCPFTFASADMFLSAVDGQMRTTIGPLKVKFRRRTTAWPAKSLAVDTFMSVRQILIWTKCCPCRNTHGHVRVRPRVGHWFVRWLCRICRRTILYPQWFFVRGQVCVRGPVPPTLFYKHIRYFYQI